LAECFLKKKVGLPVLIFSGVVDKTVEKSIREKGFEFIRKPFNIKKLLIKIRECVTGQRIGK